MMAWRLSELVRCAPGQIVGNDCAFSSVSTDSRTLQPGALFVALSGPSFDGHDFVAQAAERGAAAAIVERPLAAQIAQIVTPDPLAALSAFARSEDRRRAMMCGFQTHVAKPVEPPELLAVVASLAGRVGRSGQ